MLRASGGGVAQGDWAAAWAGLPGTTSRALAEHVPCREVRKVWTE